MSIESLSKLISDKITRSILEAKMRGDLHAEYEFAPFSRIGEYTSNDVFLIITTDLCEKFANQYPRVWMHIRNAKYVLRVEWNGVITEDERARRTALLQKFLHK